MRITLVAFDFGHTLVDEQKEASVPFEIRTAHLMPAVADVLPQISLPMAVWANTRCATGEDVREFLERAGIGKYFETVVTSVDAGFRKPAPEFFEFALSECGVTREEVLFVGNQLNTDVLGGQSYGISTVWLSGHENRSADETFPQDAQPTYTIRTLSELPGLLDSIRELT
jgi:HAD superfamily hydrolase (TIGR01509 family)